MGLICNTVPVKLKAGAESHRHSCHLASISIYVCSAEHSVIKHSHCLNPSESLWTGKEKKKRKKETDFGPTESTWWKCKNALWLFVRCKCFAKFAATKTQELTSYYFEITHINETVLCHKQTHKKQFKQKDVSEEKANQHWFIYLWDTLCTFFFIFYHTVLLNHFVWNSSGDIVLKILMCGHKIILSSYVTLWVIKTLLG